MSFELIEIKKIRRKLGLTQTQLANKASVSQSLIAKIEAGRLDPGYSKTKQIFDALEQLTRNDEICAGQIMNKKIITAKADEKVSIIIKEMKRYSISQVPVIDKEKPIGLITETALLDKLSTGDMNTLKAKDVMEECPPIITPNTKISAIANLLHYFPIVLVSDKGSLKGLISKADLLEKII